MALADSVPGVSGGTIAFILGFYDALLRALHGLFSREKPVRRQSLRALLRFYMGDNSDERRQYIIDNLIIEEDLA